MIFNNYFIGLENFDEIKSNIQVKPNSGTYYVGGKYKSIMYKCEVMATDLYGNRSYDDIEFYHGLEKSDDVRYMKLKLLEKYSQGQYPLAELKEQGLTSVQGRSKVTPQLLKYLEK